MVEAPAIINIMSRWGDFESPYVASEIKAAP
jgi:hypothetical protein